MFFSLTVSRFKFTMGKSKKEREKILEKEKKNLFRVRSLSDDHSMLFVLFSHFTREILLVTPLTKDKSNKKYEEKE